MKFVKLIEAVIIAIRNIFLGGNIMSFLLLKKPKDMIFYSTQNLFFFNTYTSRRKIPQKNVFEVLPPANNIEVIKLGNLHYGTWFSATSSPASDITSLCLICQIIKPKIIFEIGTLDGYTALHCALNSPEAARVYTLDLPKTGRIIPKLNTNTIDDSFIDMSSRIDRLCFQNDDVSSKITCLSGDSAAFDFSPFHKKVDFFFIDGSHSYEYVRSDTLNALKCCHPGSVIAWHDYGQMGMSGVDKWLHEFLKQKNEIYSIPGGSLAFMIVKA